MAEARLRWLALQESAQWGADFWPQPYEQCAAVLREMGHQSDARAVLIEKERLQRATRRRRVSNDAYRWFLWVWDRILGVTVGYGRRPLQAVAWLALFWVVGGVAYHAAASADAFKPKAAVVLRSPEWTLCGHPASETVFLASAQNALQGRAAPGQSQLDCYRAQPEARSYPSLNPWISSADVLLPVVEIEQQANWIPDPSIPAGRTAKVMLYLQIFAGWALSLLAVAGFSGLVKSD